MTKKDLILLLTDIHGAAPSLPEHIQVRLEAAMSKKSTGSIPVKFTEFSSRFYSWLSANGGKARYTEKEIHAGAVTLYRLENINGYDFENEVIPCLRWAITHDFWSQHAINLAQLRVKSKRDKKEGGLRFDNMFNAYVAGKHNLIPQPKTYREVKQSDRARKASERRARRQQSSVLAEDQGCPRLLGQ